MHGVRREGVTVRVHRGVGLSTATRDADGSLVLRGTREAPGAARREGGDDAPAAEEPFELRPDTLVSHVGFRPSYDIARELQIHVCYASEGPMKLAATLLAASAEAFAGASKAAPKKAAAKKAPVKKIVKVAKKPVAKTTTKKTTTTS